MLPIGSVGIVTSRTLRDRAGGRTRTRCDTWHDPRVSQTVDDAIARMEAILEPLPRNDGLACFTRLYLAVTKGVQAQLAGATFAHPDLLALLDVRFAGLFFSAVDASARGGRSLPRAWAPLFDARSATKIAPLQFALAGMNAHINRDLPVALVETFREIRLELTDDSPVHADYLRVNALLARVEAQEKAHFLDGWLRGIDRVLHRADRLDDVVAMWNVERARDAAWTNAEALWAIRGDRSLFDRYLTTLDRSVGLAGRGMLVPAETWLGRIGSALGSR
jgi:hypothetical protein